MKIVSVTPIARGIGKETLTYFTARDVQEGMVVAVPVRGRRISALVLSVEEATASKTALRAANFSLKKIGESKGFVLSPSFISAAKEMARHAVARTGAVLQALTPDVILEEVPTLRVPKHARAEETGKHEKLVMQGDDSEREAAYKILIREEFAKKHSVFLCVPTLTDSARLATALGHGIEDHVYVFHSELGKKELLLRWKKALKHPHPILVIGTGMFFSLPRGDISTFIIEKEHASAYKMPYRPFLDIRTFAELYTRARGGKLIVADLALRTETLYRKECREFSELTPLKFRASSRAESILVDMKKDNADPLSGKIRFTPFGAELRALIGTVLSGNERLFALVPRRGLHTVTICNDCGTMVLCERCRTPLVLHRRDSSRSTAEVKNIFMCHSCRRETAARDRCSVCTGWRLSPLGTGTESAAEILKETFPALTVFRLDKDSGSTRKKAEEIVDTFYKTPRSVLVGTELAMPFLRPLPYVAVVSCDSFFIIPDFRMNERVFAMLLALRAKAEKTFLVQTRMPHVPIFKEIIRGDVSNFFREEIRVRKEFGYPPFTTLVKLSLAGGRNAVTEEAARIETLLGNYHPIVFPARTEDPRRELSLRILLKVEKPWPDETLIEILRALPPAVRVHVDPEDTL